MNNEVIVKVVHRHAMVKKDVDKYTPLIRGIIVGEAHNLFTKYKLKTA